MKMMIMIVKRRRRKKLIKSRMILMNGIKSLIKREVRMLNHKIIIKNRSKRVKNKKKH
jgi:hypothetical protein